ncbi:MAG: TIGR03960 family B12-binding radical SAM protein [Clostridia bacterium]|nr:TIGR03960 family B12-binding radical SAM protein [Clostridia bacterium]
MLNLTRNELLSVSKPARYVGGEYNQVVKKLDNIKCRYAFCFPDIYDIGMSNLGMKILYAVLNKRKDTWCERVFAPWPDFEELMRKKNIELYGLESKDSIKNFDMVSFTLQYEMSYTNILNMLDLANIPLLSIDRKEEDPFVFAGGPCASNPYPLIKFMDFFLLGEGEEQLNQVVDKYVIWKSKKLAKSDFLNAIKEIDGVFIPSIHTRKDMIKKAVIKDMNAVEYPTNFVVPSTEIVQNRISLELFRGCSRGCRFCQAGYIYRPVREKSADRLLQIAKESIRATGLNDITLSSLSTSDYSQFQKLTSSLLDICDKNKIGLSLPSLRIDNVNLDVLNKVQAIRKSSLTFAPEAGSQRLRDVINKNITEEEILDGCKLAFENGWNTVKLYFMIGLPTETFEDLSHIVLLANKIVDVYYAIPKDKRNGKCMVTVSTSTFVPKPHTPFEWFGQNTLDKIELKQQFLKDKLKNKNIKYSWHDPKVSRLEALISRGDENISDVIYHAFKNGAKFDSWEAYLNIDAWEKAAKDVNISINDYANREYDLEHEFPWDNIMHGVTKEFLIREYNNAIIAKTIQNCSKHCAACGVTQIAKCKFLEKGD